MNKRIIWIFLLLVLGGKLQSQPRYLNFGAGAAYNLFADEGLSDLPYEGFGAYLTAALEWESPSAWHRLGLNTQIGYLSPVQHSGLGIHTLLDAGYAQLFHTELIPEPWQLSVGPEASLYINQVFQTSYSNNVLHPFWDVNLAAGARASRPFYLFKRKWELALRATVPVLGLALRPDYAYLAPRGFYIFPDKPVQAIRESVMPVYPPRWLRIKTGAELNYLLKNGNRIGASYDWYFNSIKGRPSERINRARAAGHGFYLFLKFNF